MQLRGSCVAVTGGAGFIGSFLVDHLLGQGARVKCIDDLSFGKRANVSPAAEFLRLDVAADDLRGALADADLVFHFAANATTKETQMGWNDPEADSRINALGTLRVLEAIRAARRGAPMVLASSAAVYGAATEFPIRETHPTQPLSPYGVSKLASEKYAFAYAKELGLKSAVLRIFNTYGPRQPRYVIHDLYRKLRNGSDRLEVLGTGREVRDYAFVRDTVRAAVLLAERELWGEAFNVAGGEPVTVLELATMILRELGKEGQVEIAVKGTSWQGDLPRLEADISKIRAAGFVHEYTLERGLRETLQAFASEP